MVRSPEEVRPTLEPITATSLRLLNYDPNYDDTEDMESSDAGNEEEEEEDEYASAIAALKVSKQLLIFLETCPSYDTDR